MFGFNLQPLRYSERAGRRSDSTCMFKDRISKIYPHSCLFQQALSLPFAFYNTDAFWNTRNRLLYSPTKYFDIENWFIFGPLNIWSGRNVTPIKILFISVPFQSELINIQEYFIFRIPPTPCSHLRSSQCGVNRKNLKYSNRRNYYALFVKIMFWFFNFR